MAKRGGPSGPRPWRDTPTDREVVLTKSLASYVKSETGRDVSPETIRAVRHCLPRWQAQEDTKSLRKNMDNDLEKAKIIKKRQAMLKKLREAEAELEKLGISADVEIGENGDGESDSDEDIFDDTDSRKVSASF